MLADIPNPWRAFLGDIDERLGPLRGDGPPVEIHCVGGFVVAMCYNLARSTADLDIFEVVPSTVLGPLVAAAGRGTPLAKKHGVYIDAGSRVATLPQGYAERLTEIFPGTFANLRLLVLDRYDLALSKLERNIDRDLEDVQVAVQNERLRCVAERLADDIELLPDFVHVDPCVLADARRLMSLAIAVGTKKSFSISFIAQACRIPSSRERRTRSEIADGPCAMAEASTKDTYRAR